MTAGGRSTSIVAMSVLPASFRDPAGYLYERDGTLRRAVTRTGIADYELLIRSGLYDHLAARGMMVAHAEEEPAACGPAAGTADAEAVRVLRPDRIPFITYPYEWPFSALQDAALLTLDLALAAVERGMILRDANAYNIQFRDGAPLLIDTLSFGAYREGEPWAAYGQFCRHFLAPLALAACRDIRLTQLLRVHLDGIPLDLASSMLPLATRLRPGLLIHLHLHAGAARRHERSGAAGGGAAKRGAVSRNGLLGILAGLRATVAGLRFTPRGTEWADYYQDTNYDEAAARAKRRLVAEFVAAVRPARVWDLGANDGTYSLIAAASGAFTLALDVDPCAVEANYRRMRKAGERNLLPLLADLTNPSPALGFENRERDSLPARGRPDMTLSLALIHHLAISNNLPLPRIAGMLADLAPHAAVEWVPKEDSKVALLLATRPDIFPDYTRAGFEAAFKGRFRVLRAEPLPGSERLLYLFERLA